MRDAHGCTIDSMQWLRISIVILSICVPALVVHLFRSIPFRFLGLSFPLSVFLYAYLHIGYFGVFLLLFAKFVSICGRLRPQILTRFIVQSCNSQKGLLTCPKLLLFFLSLLSVGCWSFGFLSLHIRHIHGHTYMWMVRILSYTSPMYINRT